MTEHVVLRRASDARADLQHRRELALIALDAIDEEISEVERFIDMYHRFSGVTVEEPATDDSAGTSVPSAAPDGGGSNSAIIGQVTLPERWGEFVALAEPTEATLHRPLPAQETAKPTRESDVFPPTPPLSTRVKAALTAHPDWTARQIADELGIDQRRVNDIAKTNDLMIRRLTPEEIQQKRVEGARKGGQISRSPAPDPAPEVPVTLKDKIIACNKAHPDWNSHQIAEALDTTPSKVSAYKSCYNIPIPPRAHSSPKFIPATEAPRAQAPAPAPKLIDGLSQARSVLVRQVAEKPASPEPGPASEPQHQPFTAGDQDEEPVHPTVAKFSSPNAKWFRLRRSDGMWLHMSGHGFTVEKKDGWIGKIGQLRAIRGNSRYPDAKGLQIIGVTQVAK